MSLCENKASRTELIPLFFCVSFFYLWNDSEYGLIAWHRLRRFGRPSHVDFKTSDFVKYAESLGAKRYRMEQADDLGSLLKQCFAENTVSIIDCPVDYSENMKLTKHLNDLVSPI